MQGPASMCTRRVRGSKVGSKMHGATGTPRLERVCPYLAAASAAGVKLPTTHVEASARALEELRQTQTVNSEFWDQVLQCFNACLSNAEGIFRVLYSLRSSAKGDTGMLARLACPQNRLSWQGPKISSLFAAEPYTRQFGLHTDRAQPEVRSITSLLTEYRNAHSRICNGAK